MRARCTASPTPRRTRLARRELATTSRRTSVRGGRWRPCSRRYSPRPETPGRSGPSDELARDLFELGQKSVARLARQENHPMGAGLFELAHHPPRRLIAYVMGRSARTGVGVNRELELRVVAAGLRA